MHLSSVVWLALLATVASAIDDQSRLWSWTTNTEQASQTKHQFQIESNGQNGNAEYNQTETTADFNIEDVIDMILASNRQGRNLDGFDELYSDPTVQDALQKGDDSQARNLIKDKLCMLGLMQCDESENVDHKNAYLRPSELIYAQSPNGPYRGPPRPPTKIIYGAPRPMPPGFNNKFGPPRKVGYTSGPIYSGPPFLNSPPPNFQGPIYHSKPPGPILESSPYKFDTHKEHIITNEEFHALGLGENGPIKAVANDGITGAGSNSVNVHHHYHHIDGAGTQAHDNVRAPAIVVNNPIPVPVPVSNGLVTGEYAAHQSTSSHGFSPLTSGYDHQVIKPSLSGFHSVNSAGFGGVNGIPSSGVYGGGAKPIFESVNNFDSNSNFGSSTFGGSGLGANGFTSPSLGSSQLGGNLNSYGQPAFGASSASFHSTNPDYYKKALKGGSTINSLNSYNQQLSGGFGGLYSSGQNQQNFQSARQDNFDCVCVPFDQCPARDILGRKGDLILPLDPRNLGSDIEALDDDNTNGTSNATVKRFANEANAPSSTAQSDADGLVEQTKEEVKKISKREISEKKSDEFSKADGEARLFGLGLGTGGAAGVGVGGLGGVGVGLTQKKVEPQFGVSFGLPYPSGSYPLNTFNGGYPAQNPYFGSISPNGLNLGLVNVNPLVSFQFAKNEFGQKTFKPLVNLHVTPNENLINKVGNLFKAKKFGGYGGYGGQSSLNQHYHTHAHYPVSPAVYRPHHYGGGGIGSIGGIGSGGIGSIGNHFENGPHYGGISDIYPSNYGNNYGVSGPGGYYRDNSQSIDASSASGSYFDPTGITGPSYDFDPNTYYTRSSNSSIESEQPFSPSSRASDQSDDNNYASNYANYNQNRVENQNQNQNQNQANVQNLRKTQQPANQGTRSVSFPSNRRKRSVDGHSNSDTNSSNESIAPKSKIIEKRQSFNQIPQQCGPSQVCCRRPVRPQYTQSGQCGRRNTQGITGRIKTPVYVDGDSEFGEYPWQVAILKKDPKESVYICGGTLIDAQHIITAAHCIKTYSGYDLRVRLGEWDVNHDVEFFPYIERDIVSVHVHPEYYAGTLDNDLAILKLNVPVDFSNNPHISPACLPDRHSDFTGARCWTTGWGKDAFGDFGKYQNILKEVDVPIIGHQQCEQQLRNTRLGYSYQLNPGFICAGGEEGKDACKGDGGGPMVCERNGIWQVVGVVSWGIGCGQVNVPGVYVRVSHYLDWIQQITQQRF